MCSIVGHPSILSSGRATATSWLHSRPFVTAREPNTNDQPPVAMRQVDVGQGPTLALQVDATAASQDDMSPKQHICTSL